MNDNRLGSLRKNVTWRTVLAGVLFVVAGSAAYFVTGFMTKAYRASATVVFVDPSSRPDTLSGSRQASGIASLLGVALPGGGEAVRAMAFLRSRLLVQSFVQSRDILKAFCEHQLVACDKSAGNTSESDSPLGQAARIFQRNVLGIAQSQTAGTVEVSITWFEPETAAMWANQFAAHADDELRKQTISESAERQKYLENAASNASIVELRQTIFRVMESQIYEQMLASTRGTFAFQLVDPAVGPSEGEFVRPRRAVIALVCALVVPALFLLGSFLLTGKWT